MNSFVKFVKKEIVLLISVLLAVTTSILGKTSPKMLVGAIDWRVISLLFSLMLVIQAFRSVNILDKIADFFINKCNSVRKLYFSLMLLVFFFSMVVTNDVALLTFVPITILIFKRINISCVDIIILETIAANLGSSVTPMGNPQNLFLFSFYNFSVSEFLFIGTKLGIVSLIILILFVLVFTRSKNEVVVNSEKRDSITCNIKLSIYYLFILVFVLLSVFRIVDYRLSFILSLLCISVVNIKLVAKVDFSLLVTFIAFFIFTSNISNSKAIANFFSSILQNDKNVFFTGIGLSQIISNVPASLLLSTFTNQAKALFYGVNIGGLGTLIASLASVISYKLYKNEVNNQNSENINDRYVLKFSIINVVFLVVLILIFVKG